MENKSQGTCRCCEVALEVYFHSSGWIHAICMNLSYSWVTIVACYCYRACIYRICVCYDAHGWWIVYELIRGLVIICTVISAIYCTLQAQHWRWSYYRCVQKWMNTLELSAECIYWINKIRQTYVWAKTSFYWTVYWLEINLSNMVLGLLIIMN